jgi:PAS domain S-box-containing protein
MAEQEGAEASQPLPLSPKRAIVSTEERLRLIMESVKDYAIILLDPAGRVIEWNTGAENFFGYSEAEVVGQSFALFFSPEDKDDAGRELKTAGVEGRAQNEGWHVRKDGSRFWAAGVTTALRDANGGLLGFGKVIRDWSERKRMEDHLRRVEERFRLFMENVKEYAVFMLDLDGRVVDWNLGAEHVLGYGEEILGQPFAIFFAPDERQAGVPEQELKSATQNGWASDDRWHVRKDGTYFWALGITTALRDDHGVLKGFTKVLRDSTDRKHFEEELEKRNLALQEASRRKDEFLAVLAHELRNPLAPIFNALSILVEEHLPEATRRETLLLVDRQVRQLARLVDDLLDVSRVTRGKIQLRKQPLALQVVVHNAVRTCGPLLDAHRHELSLSLPADPIWLEADPTRLEQVVVNLLTNSAKYSKDGSRITIAASRDRGVAVLSVRDAGVGIAPDLLPHVFDLFTQGKRSLDRSQGGLGIGLTLVRKLVELHDGTVEARSEGANQGSEFVVRLPILQEVPKPAPLQSTVQAPLASENPLRILVVDDNVDAAESMRLLLTMMGHDVQTLHTGAGAVQAATELQPDVMLLDIGLPGLTGYEVAEQIRGTKGLENILLAAVTGYGQEEDHRRSKKAGFDYHLVKPVDPQQLVQILIVAAEAGKKPDAARGAALPSGEQGLEPPEPRTPPG